MKSASAIQLSKAWWKKEAPEGLKSYAAFEKAIDAYSKANAGLRDANEKTVAGFEDALEGLLDAGQKVAAECRKLLGSEKKSAAKARLADLENTVQVMEKALPREVEDARDAIPDLDDDDDEEGGDKLTDARLHGVYLKKMAGKLKRRVMTFGLGMPTKEPSDMRILFHPKKAGRSLAAMVKKTVGAQRFTFGLAGTQALAAQYGVEGANARTLVVKLEGRNIPGLPKRLKMMMRALKVATFGKFIVIGPNGEIEEADEADEDDALPEIADFDTPEEIVEAPEEAAAPDPVAAPEEAPQGGAVQDDAARLAGLKQRLGAAVPKIKQAPPQIAAELGPLAKTAKGHLDQGALDPAEEAIARIETALGAPAPAPAEEAPQGAEEAARLAGLRSRLGAAVPKIKEAAAPLAAELAALAKAAKGHLDQGGLDAAEEAILRIETALGLGAPAPEEQRPEASEQAAEIEAALLALGQRIVALGPKGAADAARELGARAREIQSMLRAGQVQDAAAALARLEEAVAAAEQAAAAAGEAAFLAEIAETTDPMDIWNAAKELIDKDLTALTDGLRSIGHPDLDKICDYGLNGATEGNQTALAKALFDYRAAPAERKPAAAAALRQQVETYRSFIRSNQLLALCEDNPFDIRVSIKDPIDRALDRIAEVVA